MLSYAQLLLATVAVGQECPILQTLGTGYGFDSPARHAVEFDDDGPGPGTPRLILSGEFTRAAGMAADGLAVWDGSALSAVFGAPAGPKGCMAVFDRGDGAALYVAGAAGTLHLLRGGTWSHAVPPEFQGLTGRAASFAVFDPDGPGVRPVGLFSLIHYAELAGEANSVVWRYDAQGWYRLSGPVPAGKIIGYDADGAGPGVPALHHVFNVVRPDPQRTVGYVRKLHPTHWEQLCYTGATPSLGITDAMTFDPDGGGADPPLFVMVGEFNQIMPGAAGQWLVTDSGACWDGSQWAGFQTSAWPFTATAVGAFTSAQGPALLAGGYPAPPEWFAIFTAWHKVPSWRWAPVRASIAYGPSAVTVAREFDPDALGPRRPQLVFSGELHSLDGTQVERFGVLNEEPGEHRVLGGMYTPGPDPVVVLETLDRASGTELYAGGYFRPDPGSPTLGDGVARWNGSGWERLGTGVWGEVDSLHSHDDGSGAQLYVGGYFAYVDGVSMWNLARWDGTTWSRVGQSQVFGYPYTAHVYAMASFDPDGNGPEPHRLYVGGNFGSVDGRTHRGLVRWDGAEGWRAVPDFGQAHIRALQVLDDGTGEALYAGCGWGEIAGLPSNRIYKLTHSGWVGLPDLPRMPNMSVSEVTAIALDRRSAPPRLLAIRHSQSGSYQAPVWRHLFRLEAGGWVQLEQVDSSFMREVVDGTEWSLVLGSRRLTPSGWIPLEPMPDGLVNAVSPVIHDGQGAAVVLGGAFRTLRDEEGRAMGAGRVATMRLCGASTCYANCDGSTAVPVLNIADFTCFLQRFAAGDAWANCDQSTAAPVLNVADFACFLQRFAEGCP